jgi:predicted nucleic acid-binding Zn ribbon protein
VRPRITSAQLCLTAVCLAFGVLLMVQFRTQGKIAKTLLAESSAWATQLRLLTRTLMARLKEQVGEGVVTSVVVRGPAQPDWRKGGRRVQGPGARGPRDTYG